MIKVTAGIHSAFTLYFEDVEDVARNFKPDFNADRPQNFDYVDTEKNEYISWQVIVKARQEIAQQERDQALPVDEPPGSMSDHLF